MKQLLTTLFLFFACIGAIEGQPATIDSLSRMLKSNLPIIDRQRMYETIIRAHISTDDSTHLIAFSTAALQEATKIDKVHFEAVALFFLGDSYFKIGNNRLALEYYKKSLSAAELYKDTRMIINASNNLRFYARDQENALFYALKAYKASELYKSTRGMAISSMYVGHAYKALERWNDALQYYNQCYSLSLKDSNNVMIANALMSLGNVALLTQNPDTALLYYRSAKSHGENPKENSSLPYSLTTLADYYKSILSDSALYYYKLALIKARAFSNYVLQVTQLNEISKLLTDDKQYKASNDSISKALAIIENHNFEPKAELYKTRAENYKQLGDSKTAFFSLERYNELLIKENQKERSSTNLLMDYNDEKNKNRQLSLELQKTLAEKKQFSAEAKERVAVLENKNANERADFIKRIADVAITRQKEDSILRQIAQNSETRAKSNEKRALENEESQRILIKVLIVISILLFVAATIARALYRKNKRVSKEIIVANERVALETIQANEKELKFASAIKTHNLVHHYDNIREAIILKKNKQLEEYLESSSTYFRDFYASLLKERISLQEELEIFEKFYSTENILKKKKVIRSIYHKNVDIAHTVFLSDTLVCLYQNAQINAFVDDDKEYTFSVGIERRSDLLYCRIADDGTGDSQINSKIREDSYLNVLENRIFNAFIKNKMKTDAIIPFEVHSSEQTGTVIKFILPYESM